MAKSTSLTKHASRSANLFLETVMLLLPAVAGGAAGAGLGRNSLIAGGALLTAANWQKWPAWVQTLAIGMAVNGVATAKPVTENQQAAVTEGTEGEQLGMLPFVPDNFMERGEQYLKNILMKAYIDQVPVVSDFVGLSGIDNGGFMPSTAAKINLNPAARKELNLLMSQRTAGAMAGIDSAAFDDLSLAGIDEKQFAAATVPAARDGFRRRRAA